MKNDVITTQKKQKLTENPHVVITTALVILIGLLFLFSGNLKAQTKSFHVESKSGSMYFPHQNSWGKTAEINLLYTLKNRLSLGYSIGKNESYTNSYYCNCFGILVGIKNNKNNNFILTSNITVGSLNCIQLHTAQDTSIWYMGCSEKLYIQVFPSYKDIDVGLVIEGGMKLYSRSILDLEKRWEYTVEIQAGLYIKLNLK